MNGRLCTGCNKQYPPTFEYFSPDKGRKDGLKRRCKKCLAEYERKRTSKPEIRSELNRRQNERYANDEKYRERTKAKMNERYANDPAYREATKARTRAHSQEKYWGDPLFRLQKLAKGRQWRKTKTGKLLMRVAQAKLRAGQIGSPGTFTAADVERQYAAQAGRCWHCGKALEGNYHIDHLRPLSRGGTNSANNIVCACPFCNKSKSGKLVQEWNGRLI